MTFRTRLLHNAQGDNTRSREEQEEKLILTAWQNMVGTPGSLSGNFQSITVKNSFWHNDIKVKKDL